MRRRKGAAFLALALLTTACGSSHHSAPPPVVKSPIDAYGVGIAVYAPPEAFRGTFAGGVSTLRPGAALAVFGDSLTVQASDYLTALARYGGLRLFGGWRSGSALCDWMGEIRTVLADVRPTDLVLGFAGNVRPCTGAVTGSAVGRVYERDARIAAALAAQVGTHVVLVGPPDMRPRDFARRAGGVRRAFARVADGRRNVDYVDSRDVLSPDGYTATLACAGFESAPLGCGTGEIVVRAADGVHWAQPNVRGYSGGAWRWAKVMVSDVKPAPNSLAAHD
jgi:hypothetical protein